MSFPRYPTYKPSGVEWLGEVPEHWNLKPVFWAASERDEDNKGMKEDNLLSLSYGNIVNKDINTSDGLLPESFETYQIVRPGDIVLRLTDLQNDKKSLRSALVTQAGIITSAYLALRPDCIDSNYLNFLFRSYDVSKVFYSMGGGLMQSMKYGDIKRMPLVIPTKTEQAAIANFLDHQTAKIDALIAEQQRLIELLQEKRQAVISHAVTKGLNPHAPMKDSGVEWLGEVPEHWEVKQLVRLVTLQRGHDITKDSQEEGQVPVLSSGGISSYHSRAICEGPAIVVGRKGTAGSLFFVEGCFWPHDTTLYSVDLHGNSAKYSFYYLHSIDLPSFDTGSSNPTLNRNRLHPFKIAAPNLEEQEKIVDYLDCKIEKLDFICETVREQIGLLGERRSALISAAVTGQIDVRGLVPEAVAA